MADGISTIMTICSMCMTLGLTDKKNFNIKQLFKNLTYMVIAII